MSSVPAIVVSAGAGGLVGGRLTGSWIGVLAGGGLAAWILPPYVDRAIAAVWTWPELTDGQAQGDAAASAAGLHVGAAVVRPTVGDAVILLRPILPMLVAVGGRKLAAAAIVNAYAESRLDPLAAGDVEDGVPQAIGLWQLHSRGAGKGMSVAQRTDPIASTKRILDVAKKAGDAPDGGIAAELYAYSPLAEVWPLEETPVGQALGLKSEATLPELVRWWCADVERPADASRTCEARVGLLGDVYVRQVLTGLGLPTQ